MASSIRAASDCPDVIEIAQVIRDNKLDIAILILAKSKQALAIDIKPKPIDIVNVVRPEKYIGKIHGQNKNFCKNFFAKIFF